jgi:hypothetical protein
MPRVWRYVLAYTLWVVSIAMALLTANTIRTSLVRLLDIGRAGVAEVDEWQRLMARDAADRFSIVVLAVLLMVFILVTEHLYRTGVRDGRLWRHFVLVTAILVGIWFACDALVFVSASAAGFAPFSGIFIPLLELAVLVALSWLYSRLKRRPPARA